MDDDRTSETDTRTGFRTLDHELVGAVLLYATVVAAAYLRFGTLPVFDLGVASAIVFPLIGLATGSREFLKTSVLFVAVLLTYEALQGATGILVASGNVASLAGVDRALMGSDIASDVQEVFASSATTLVSTIFYGLHLFLVLIAFAAFWFKDKTVFRRYAYSLVVTSYLALVTFVILPTAPPWLAGAAQNLLASGDKMLPGAIQELQAVVFSGESDIYAAFPSLHVAYATLFTIFMFKLGRKYGFTSLPVLGGVCFSVVYLGQHYLVDVLAGVAYAAISAYLVGRVMARRRKSRTALQVVSRN